MKKVLALVLVLVAVVVIGGLGYFKLTEKDRLSIPDEIALAAMQSDVAVEVSEEKWLVFRPRNAEVDTALVFYPGAYCDPRGYAEPLSRIAAAGFLVVAVPMPFHLAVLNVGAMDDVRGDFPEIRRWFLGGHSLGGAMASNYAKANADRVDGLIIWDSHPSDADTLVDVDFPVTLIHRADPNGVAPTLYQEKFHLFPESAAITGVPGGNHMNFGNFIVPPDGYQDVEATIPARRQQDIAVKASIAALTGS